MNATPNGIPNGIPNGVRNGVSAVVLAAGAGSRFGGGKLLAEFRGRPLVAAVLENLADAPVDEVVVVLGTNAGADARALRDVCERHGARVVENPDWERGQATSVLAGLAALGPAARAAVVVLGDQPLVGAGAVGRLVEAFEEGTRVAVAVYRGRRRNPVLFSRGVWPSLGAELVGDEGARGWLRRHPELVVGVDCTGVADPADVDTREDLRRLEEMRGFGDTFKMVRKEEVP